MPKYVVRYGAMRAVGVLSARGNDRVQRGTKVIARTDRGLEAAEVLCVATEAAVSQLKNPAHGQIVRLMSLEDENELIHMQAQARDEFEICQKHVADLKLEMELVDLEHVFGGERIIVYYLAEERVDFRELVRKLAAEFQTRIEMRQIGVRDEAKLLADYGDCGKPVCCGTHLSSMPPVSMKMAKLQKATLDPTKISGRCGRLKCCLRYEYDTYVNMQRDLPRVGSDVITRNGRARVLNQSILAQQLLVETEEHRRLLINADEVLTVLKRENPPRSSKPEKKQPKKQDKGKPAASTVAPSPKPAEQETAEQKTAQQQPAEQKPSEQKFAAGIQNEESNKPNALPNEAGTLSKESPDTKEATETKASETDRQQPEARQDQPDPQQEKKESDE